jgi:Putative peptidoglycan binding domain
VLADAPPSISHVHETRPRGDPGSLVGGIAAQPHEDPLDDWLGDISDEDWTENATRRPERRSATLAYQELPVRDSDRLRDPSADRPPPAAPVAADEAYRVVIKRRRLVAGLVVVVVLGLAVVIPVLLLRGGAQAPVTAVPEPTITTPEPRETSPSSASTTPSTTAPATASSSPSASAFTLPEGTKLRLGEGDPAVIKELQQALVTAGYDPGPVDGTFGRRTEAAVVAFQQANGLSVDGAVGPETASALNSVVAGG